MIKKVKYFIIDNNMIKAEEKILVALSGGPDSVCLLHILYSLKEKLNIKLGAIHINHMLRGEEALKDERYVNDICEKLRIDCYIERIDINKVASENSISLEMAGREERYKAFQKIKEKYGYDKVAVAHNANDQAETILMRMMRGTGLEGLVGIKAVREGGIIRPILCLNRSEIESYCAENHLMPRIDKSNMERIYSRNKVRLDILPYMKENFNKDIIDTLNRMALILSKDNEYIEEQSNKCYEEYCKCTNHKIVIEQNLFVKEKEAIVTRVIKRAFKEISKSHQNFEMKHIYDVIDLYNKGTGKSINLTNSIIAENTYGDIIFKKKNNMKITKDESEVSIIKESVIEEIKFKNYMIKMEVIDREKNVEFSNNALIKLFDYDKIEERIVIRNRKDGDKMKPLGIKGTKKLKDIFINLKVPREERDVIPLICFDDEIAWIVGYKVSESFKITKSTKRVLKISFEGKE
ncbi:tRNA lysidine(34) synthetase TilS [uncultured Clostridium sp.]|uniref:tRNA lysidine(34) synthetase TilS n=1 Tax=uncultured Clostridium sp. TaxID=59620 RepID=UPI00267332C8|nr:tRNA lysidine(34) synthetase TilS [uncultured Clostridium sp.]